MFRYQFPRRNFSMNCTQSYCHFMCEGDAVPNIPYAQCVDGAWKPRRANVKCKKIGNLISIWLRNNELIIMKWNFTMKHRARIQSTTSMALASMKSPSAAISTSAPSRARMASRPGMLTRGAWSSSAIFTRVNVAMSGTRMMDALNVVDRSDHFAQT